MRANTRVVVPAVTVTVTSIISSLAGGAGVATTLLVMLAATDWALVWPEVCQLVRSVDH